MAKHFTKADFNKEVIEASAAKPALVDFFAPWCGPCQMMGPIIDKLAVDLEGKAIIGKIDTEQEAELSEQFGVMSIPTLVVFKGGKVVETLVGLQSKESLEAALKKHS